MFQTTNQYSFFEMFQDVICVPLLFRPFYLTKATSVPFLSPSVEITVNPGQFMASNNPSVFIRCYHMYHMM